MNENTKILLAVIITAAICIPVTYLVSGSDNDEGADSVTLSVAGSTTVLPLMSVYAETYEKYTNVTLEVTGGGSGAGASAVINGTASFGMLSRDLKQSELDAGLKATVIAKDGVAVIVGSDAGVTDLTLKQIAGIYSGEFTNWNQVGGTDGATIAVVTREDGSGTRSCFEEVMEDTDSDYELKIDATVATSTGAVVTTVEDNPNAIGYVSFGALDRLVNATAVDVGGVAADTAFVVDGTYELQRNLLLATDGEPTGSVEKLFSWILGPEGQALVEDEGFIAVK